MNQSWELNIQFLGIIYKPWRSFMVGCGIFGLTAAIMTIFLPESPKFLLTAGYPVEAFNVIKKMHSRNCGKQDTNLDVRFSTK